MLTRVAILHTLVACPSSPSTPDVAEPDTATPVTTLELALTRVPSPGLDPFEVTATVRVDGIPTPGKPVTATVRGAATTLADAGDGTYTFTVTPAATGVYPVTVSVDEVTQSREALVLDLVADGAGQPLAVPGAFVNTPGYEDGITITPDGQYLFVQYGPVYFSGIANVTAICADPALSAGYNLNTCANRPNAGLVFDTIGPYAAPARPNFHAEAIVDGHVRHLPGFVIPDVANGLAATPTAFYGFHRQPDGTFAEPFRVAFDDPKGINGPFGLSFVQRADGTTTFALAWNNFLADLGDDGADIYTGTLTLGEDHSLGTVTYGAAFDGDSFASITPTIQPVGFPSHAGQQGNPHLATDGSGAITSIWTDDETGSKDLAVYRLTAGGFPAGTWVRDSLPPVINTPDEEDQPFFTGRELILSRGASIVSHAYRPTNGACGGGFASADCWGPELVLLGGLGSTTAGQLFGVGEPTVATVDGKRLLYFVYVEARDPQQFPGIVDFDLNAGFVELP